MPKRHALLYRLEKLDRMREQYPQMAPYIDDVLGVFEDILNEQLSASEHRQSLSVFWVSGVWVLVGWLLSGIIPPATLTHLFSR